MKQALVIILSVIGLSMAALDIPDHLQAPMKVLRRACLAESGVDEKYVDQSKNGYLPDVPELKCYVLCLLEHAGVIEADNTIHFDDIMHLLPQSNKDSVTKVFEACKTIHGESRCDTAWRTIKCYFEIEPEGATLP